MNNNKLIAEFMEYPDLGTEGDFSYLKYHKSWDWLMPVVEKIESNGFEFQIIGERAYINHNSDKSIANLLYVEKIGTKIENTYEAVIEFIKYYNNESKI